MVIVIVSKGFLEWFLSARCKSIARGKKHNLELEPVCFKCHVLARNYAPHPKPKVGHRIMTESFMSLSQLSFPGRFQWTTLDEGASKTEPS